MRFPIGTKKAAKIIKCSERTIKRHCRILKIRKLNVNTGSYTIYENDLEKLKNSIYDKPGRPPIYDK